MENKREVSAIDGAVARNYKGDMDSFYRISAIPKATFYRWRKDPERMTVSALRRIDRTVHFSDEEIVEIVRGGRRWK